MIKEQVQQIINSRKGLGEYAGMGRLEVIQRSLAFTEKLEAEINAFDDFLQIVHQDLREANGPFADLMTRQPLFGGRLNEVQLQELKRKISRQKDELLRLQNRFSRDSVQIAFIGQARQGKSSFLQRISGLSDETIPSSSATDCTGAISIIQNYNGDKRDFFEIELEFYSVLEFIAAVNNKLAQLFPQSNIQISSINEITALTARPEFQNIEDEDIAQFKETYIDGYNIYESLLGKANEVLDDESVVAEMVAKYKMFASEGNIPRKFSIYRQKKKSNSGVIQVLFCKYVAVKVAYIKKRFLYPDAGNIVLVDTIGLGNAPTETEDKAKMFEVLKNESDAAVYIYKPSEDGASKKPKAEMNLLEELEKELRDYSPAKWLVGVINKKSEETCSKKGRDYEVYLDNLNDIRQTFSSESVLAWCEIVDAMSEKEVTEKLVIPLLQTIIQNIDGIDSSFMIRANDNAESLYREYMDICSKVEALGSMFVTNENKKAIFDAEFENLPLKSALRAYVDTLYQQINEPSWKIIDDLYPFVEQIMSYVPKSYEIEQKIAQGGTYDWAATVYVLYMDSIRSQILSTLKYVGSQSILALQRTVQNDIIGLMYEAGMFNRLKLKSSSSDHPTREWFQAVISEKLNFYPVLKSAFMSVADFEMRIEGFLYSKCICACELLRPGKTQIPQIEDVATIEDKAICIQQALYAVMMEVKQKLIEELGLPQKRSISSDAKKPIEELAQPNLILWCMADIFQQEIRNGQGAKELENFYWENANYIWREKILQGEKLHKSAAIWNTWIDRLNSLCELNNFNLLR